MQRSSITEAYTTSGGFHPMVGYVHAARQSGSRDRVLSRNASLCALVKTRLFPVLLRSPFLRMEKSYARKFLTKSRCAV